MGRITDADTLAFIDGYVEAALWSSTDEAGHPLDARYSKLDLSAEAMDRVMDDCLKFLRENADDLAKARSPAENGHDFWLTRNGHGVGFWDRGLEEVGERLTEACDKYGECWLYVWSDGKLYFM